MFKITDQIKKRLSDNALNLCNMQGELFEIKFNMQGHFRRFKEYIENNTTLILTELYNESKNGFMYYIAFDSEYCKERMHKYYIQIFQNRLLFNNVNMEFKIEAFCNLFEVIKNKLDSNAELWFYEREKLI